MGNFLQSNLDDTLEETQTLSQALLDQEKEEKDKKVKETEEKVEEVEEEASSLQTGKCTVPASWGATILIYSLVPRL